MKLINYLQKHFSLNWQGIHGINHWTRVRENGLFLAKKTKANKKVVELFALFHDCRRENEGYDPEHGRRGAELALRLNKSLFDVDEEELGLLRTACSLHTHAKSHEDVTIQTCFDADRLDLGRVGIMPDPKFLSTSIAQEQEVISWAYRRSIGRQ